MNIQSMIELMEKRGVASRKDLVGVSEREVCEMEKTFGFTFPEAYRIFLRTFGRSAGYLSIWMAIYFDDLEEIQENYADLRELTNQKLDLPSDLLLISCADSMFDYLICDKKVRDPIVYRINLKGENGAVCERFADSFSDYLVKLIEASSSQKPEGQHTPFYVDECGELIYEK